MKFNTRLKNALNGEKKDLEFLMRWISPSSWRVSNKEIANKTNEIVTTCDEIIIKDQNPNAIFLRALIFQYCDENYFRAKSLYEQAYKNGHILAASRLADLLARGLGCKTDLGQAFEICKLGLEAKDSEAYYLAGFICEQKQNVDTAIDYYEKAIKQNHASAMFVRATFHAEGHGGPRNIDEAIKLYDKAIELNHTLAMCHRAKIHFSNEHKHSNPVAGVKLLRQALKDKHNYSHAQVLLESIATTLNTEVAYHAAIALHQLDISKHLIQFIKSHPYEFVNLLQKDEITSVFRKTEYLDLMNNIIPAKNINSVDVPSYKIICQCYITAAEKKLAKKKFAEALELYLKIPVDPRLAEINGKVYHAIATIIYDRALVESSPIYAGFDLAKHYLELGIQNHNKDCEETYKKIIKEIVGDKEFNSLTDYQREFENYKANLPPGKFNLETFIAKHHLRNLDYWHQQNKKNNSVESVNSVEIKDIPSEIFEIHEIIFDDQKNEFEKVAAITTKMNSAYHFFRTTIKSKVFDLGEPIANCIDDAKKLTVKM